MNGIRWRGAAPTAPAPCVQVHRLARRVVVEDEIEVAMAEEDAALDPRVRLRPVTRSTQHQRVGIGRARTVRSACRSRFCRSWSGFTIGSAAAAAGSESAMRAQIARPRRGATATQASVACAFSDASSPKRRQRPKRSPPAPPAPQLVRPLAVDERARGVAAVAAGRARWRRRSRRAGRARRVLAAATRLARGGGGGGAVVAAVSSSVPILLSSLVCSRRTALTSSRAAASSTEPRHLLDRRVGALRLGIAELHHLVAAVAGDTTSAAPTRSPRGRPQLPSVRARRLLTAESAGRDRAHPPPSRAAERACCAIAPSCSARASRSCARALVAVTDPSADRREARGRARRRRRSAAPGERSDLRASGAAAGERGAGERSWHRIVRRARPARWPSSVSAATTVGPSLSPWRALRSAARPTATRSRGRRELLLLLVRAGAAEDGEQRGRRAPAARAPAAAPPVAVSAAAAATTPPPRRSRRRARRRRQRRVLEAAELLDEFLAERRPSARVGASWRSRPWSCCAARFAWRCRCWCARCSAARSRSTSPSAAAARCWCWSRSTSRSSSWRERPPPRRGRSRR